MRAATSVGAFTMCTRHIHNHYPTPTQNDYPDLKVPALMPIFQEKRQKNKSLTGYGLKNKAQMHQLFTTILNKHK